MSTRLQAKAGGSEEGGPMDGYVEDEEGRRANGVPRGTGAGKVRANSALPRRGQRNLRVPVVKVSDEKKIINKY